MVFSSNIFLLVFLPTYMALYYLTPPRFRSYTIIVGSYVFYAWWRVDFLALIILISFWSYSASVLIERSKNDGSRLWYMWVGVAGNLLCLAYFKYFNFLFDNINGLVGAFGGAPFDVWNVILPIGISFHVFQSISYVVDVYRKDVPPARNFVDFMAFTSLFPQLIAGPVLRYKDLVHQFEGRIHSWANFNAGATLVAIGLAKKILIADSVAPVANLAFGQLLPTAADAWLGALSYTAQLYFDFSGYSDMATGMGLMMGFVFIRNFNDPYISRSITEFWRRWHISLSTWLRDYLYIPLGGNRRGPVRTYVNLTLTMALGGFWHGANWTFLLWGIWHGGWMALERRLGTKGEKTVYPTLIALPLTFLIVLVGWVIFRAPTLEVALRMYKGMVGLSGWSISDNLAWQLTLFQVATLLLAFVIIWLVPLWRRAVPYTSVWNPDRLLRIFAAPLFVLAVTKLSAQSYSPFLYFQF